ncbi:MAG: hypothetical protein KKB13_20495 [Chloroflexi bacterium]|nr:hypothetical protein [Chloroflexota bacterium]
MHRIVLSSFILALLFLLTTSVAGGQAPVPVIATHDLPPGTVLGAGTAGPTGDAWFTAVHLAGVSLVHLMAEAPPTGGVAPIMAITSSLVGLTTTVAFTGYAPSTVLAQPVQVVTATALMTTPRPGLVQYQWPTETLWLSSPISGARHGAPGLWVNQAGAIGFLAPNGALTMYQSAAIGSLPARLAATTDAVWGITEGRAFMIAPDAPTATVLLGSYHPTALSHADQTGPTHLVYYGDWARRAIVRLAYSTATGNHTLVGWVLPGLREPSQVIRIPTGATYAAAAAPRWAAHEWPDGVAPPLDRLLTWEFWYLDRPNNRLARLRPYEYELVEYDLPAPLALGSLSYDGTRLWFSLATMAGGELAAFDPRTAVLTRYQSRQLPGLPEAAAPGWAAAGSRAYQWVTRWLWYLPIAGRS